MHCAAAYGHLEVARLLMERGADKEAKNSVRAPHATAAARRVDALRGCVACHGPLPAASVIVQSVGRITAGPPTLPPTPPLRLSSAALPSVTLCPQEGKTPLEVIRDSSIDSADVLAAKEATRALLRSQAAHHAAALMKEAAELEDKAAARKHRMAAELLAKQRRDAAAAADAAAGAGASAAAKPDRTGARKKPRRET